MDYKHPQGGRAKYLSGPLLENQTTYVQRLADNVLDGSLAGAMTEDVEALAGEVFEAAPREFWDLRESAHPSVDDDGATVYDRPPVVHRLTPEELRLKDRLRNQGAHGGVPNAGPGGTP